MFLFLANKQSFVGNNFEHIMNDNGVILVTCIELAGTCFLCSNRNHVLITNSELSIHSNCLWRIIGSKLFYRHLLFADITFVWVPKPNNPSLIDSPFHLVLLNVSHNKESLCHNFPLNIYTWLGKRYSSNKWHKSLK